MEKNYRIHTNIVSDTVLNVNMSQDYEFLNVLTMSLSQVDAYRLHSSNYGVIVGRVLANDAFGIPNARVSIFIERDKNDPTYMESLYPYQEVMDKDKDGRRYNLLPSDSDDDCYRIVGTFPNKRLILDDNVQLEIFDKYYKFTTVTNNAGDYMLFGVPSGNQQLHVDMDLSDIGILSQTPTDFEYKGYSMTMFDSPRQFKESTNLDGLAQLFSQNKSVFVYPFWGDMNLDNGIAAITRCDVQIQYKFEPTCVFMGSIISDNEGNSIGHRCSPSEDNGMNSQLIAGEGTIEMIRKTQDGLVEEYSIQGNQLIDTNGVWCYQIPMNLDFIGTDEYGNIVPTDNPNKGIPTRTQVRFRFSKLETGDEGHSRHTAKYLVPMNPTLIGDKPTTVENSEYIEKMYTFGSSTPEDCFRDLYWNNVYSVKNYIPKTQVAHRPHSPNYTGLKGSNLVDDQNPVPFNKLRIDIPFMYAVVCIIFNLIALIVWFINKFIIGVINTIIDILNSILNICIPFLGCVFNWAHIGLIGCISLGAGLSDDNTAFYPGCGDDSLDASDCPEGMENCNKRASVSVLMDLVQQKLAQDYKIVKLDFFQDWINGSLYMPLWYWRKRRKKSFLFGLFSTPASNEFCDCNRSYSRMKSYLTCSFIYNNKKLKLSSGNIPESDDEWHRGKSHATMVGFSNGLIKGVTNKDGLTAYYYTALNPTNEAIGKGVNENEGFEAIRLFATDIILLGNLNEDNLYGLPQFFNALPSTTANIPPIATIHDAVDDTEEEKNSKNTLSDSGDTSGPSMTTGMDWVDWDEGGPPSYKNGLFMNLECTYADTKAKSCINVERLSELGMNLDMSYSVQYPTSSGFKEGTFETDGLITKYELDDTENRAMFATMNHLGFIPQTYQNKLRKNYGNDSFYTTQVLDENTNYYIPKFKYLYPTDLDGRMKVLTERYKYGNFKQVMSDDADEAYINFRLGDVQGKSNFNGEGQFYIDDNSMPLYNNSFYFYFGVKKGNTAIEKFNKMFSARCFKNTKYPFTLEIEKRGASYCPVEYKKEDDAIGYIKFTSDDIEIPYSYRLYTSLGKLVNFGDDYETNEYTISAYTNGELLENGTYNLRVVDYNGRSLIERVRLEMPKITISAIGTPLGTKYYEDLAKDAVSKQAQIERICEHYNGTIEFSDLFIDNYRFDITNVEYVTTSEELGYGIGKFYVYGSNELFKTEYKHIANIYVSVSKDDNEESTNTVELNINEYLCSDAFYMHRDGLYVTDFGLRVHTPATFDIKIAQICDGKEMEGDEESYSANITTQAVTVDNGENFYAYLNTMPVKFMIDKGNEYFYPPVTNYDSTNYMPQLKHWIDVQDPASYVFPNVGETKVWQDFIGGFVDETQLTDEEDRIETLWTNRQNILLYKFEKLFNLCKATYVVGRGGENTFQYTATGGIQPTLYRSLTPCYDDTDLISTNVIYSDNNSTTVNAIYPNIVGYNYNDETKEQYKDTIRINNNYIRKIRNYIGNYFGAFSSNGMYNGNDEGDCNIFCEAIPTNATPNLTNRWKELGDDEELTTVPALAYQSGTDICKHYTNPYFRAMFVDRRLDYDLVALGPFGPDRWPLKLVEALSSDTSNERVDIELGNPRPNGGGNDTPIVIDVTEDPTVDSADLKTAKEVSDKKVQNVALFGYFYNGIEMSYEDETYNVISRTEIDENTNEEIHYNYEYDYVLTEDKADAILTPSSNLTTIKRYYEAKLGTANIVNYFVSSENYLGNQFYIDKFGNRTIQDDEKFALVYTTSGPVNGWFSGENYPAKRYINFREIDANNELRLKVSSCSFNINLKPNFEANEFTGIVSRGETLDVKLKFNQTLVPPPLWSTTMPNPNYNIKKNIAELDYGHFNYHINGYDVKSNSSASGTEYVYIEKIGTLFEYQRDTNGKYDVYVSVPRYVSIGDLTFMKKTQSYDPSMIEEWWKKLRKAAIIQPSFLKKDEGEEYGTYGENSDGYITMNGHEISISDGAFRNIHISNRGFSNRTWHDNDKGKGLTVQQMYENSQGDKEVSAISYTYKALIDSYYSQCGGLVYQYDVGSLTDSSLIVYNKDISYYMTGENYLGMCYKKKYVAKGETKLKNSIVSYEFTKFYYCGPLEVEYNIVNEGGNITIKQFDVYETKKRHTQYGDVFDRGRKIEGTISANIVFEVNVNYMHISQRYYFTQTLSIGEASTITYDGVSIPIIVVGHKWVINIDDIRLTELFVYLTTDDNIRYRFAFGESNI